MRCCRFLAATLALAPAGAVWAGEARSVFTASATVLPVVSLHTVTATPALRLTQADCDAGVVTVTVEYTVRTNDPRGYQLRLAPRIGLASEVLVTGLPVPLVVEADEIVVHRPVGAGRDPLRIEFRVKLLPDAMPGRYPMPIAVSAHPI